MAEEIVIPDKPAFKASEVCELLKLQPYVLKSWENEFKDLGVAKSVGGPRVYRRVDVERAVRIRDLMLREGLTLAGVRRRLEQEGATADAEDALIAEIAASRAPAAAPERGIDRERVLQVKQGLRELLETLSKPAVAGPGTARDEATEPSAGPEADAGAALRELTVVADEAPSLFGDDEPMAARGEPASKTARRKRGPRAPAPPAD